MISLDAELMLYHGSYAPIEEIRLEQCAPGRDFGQGFYLTTSVEQARRFVPLACRKRARNLSTDSLTHGFITSFRFTPNPGLMTHVFPEADIEWLHFVAANRRTSLFANKLRDLRHCDVIAGKVANDRTARTLQLYVSGAYGEPGSNEADAIAIATLLPNRLEDQVCFRTETGISCLTFEGSERIDFATR